MAQNRRARLEIGAAGKDGHSAIRIAIFWWRTRPRPEATRSGTPRGRLFAFEAQRRGATMEAYSASQKRTALRAGRSGVR